MDTIGKIFAFIVLVCAVAFVSAAYVLTQETKNWKAEKERVEKELGAQITQLKADKAQLEGEVQQAKQKQTEAEAAKRDADATVSERDAKIKAQQLEIDTQSKNEADLRAQLNKAQDLNTTLNNEKTALQGEKDKAVTERQEAVTAREKAEDALALTQDELKKTQGQLTIKTKQLEDALKTLEQVELVFGKDWRNRIAGTTEVVPLIKGAVLKADNKSGIVLVSVGKSDGVKQGMTFEVVRPEAKQYVGRIEVYQIDDQVAYCRIDPAMTKDPIEEGDYVATRLQ